MPIAVKEWVQDAWLRPGVELWRKNGDFLEVSNLIPTRDGLQLVRTPAWSAQVRTDTNGLTDVRGAFFDADNDRIVLVGADGSGDLASAYLSSAWSLSSNTTLNSTPTNLGGCSMRNVAWFGGVLYAVGSNGKLYSGSSYTGALTSFNANTWHHSLAPIDERLYSCSVAGRIDMTNYDNSSLTVYDAPINDLGTPMFFSGYRGYGLLITQDAEGLIRCIRVPLDASTKYFQELTTLHEYGVLPDYGSLACFHDDEIYFSPGYYTRMGSENALNVYAFNGSYARHVAEIRHDPNTGGSGFPTAAGLLSWRGELLYYAMEGTAQIFKVLRGERFAEFATLSATASAQPFAAVVGGHLIATADDTNEGIHYLQDTAADDGYVITPRLDMGSPGREKRLSRIAVLLSDAATSFGCKVEYRVNDTAAWTSGGTDSNTQRAEVSDLGVSFYTLQVKVTLDDDTGSNEDIRIDALSVIYSIGEG